MPRDDSAALAANWKTIVAVDLAMGIAVLAAGLVLAFGVTAWGWAVATVGMIQLFFAGGRISKWRRLRKAADL